MIYGKLIASMIRCLKNVLELDSISSDARESLEVSIQCLESAYNVHERDAPDNFDILHLYKTIQHVPDTNEKREPSAEMKKEAERLKNEGNDSIRAEKYPEAASLYTKAIELHPRNAVYYCNRAAVYSKLGEHDNAIRDCQTALSIDPQYSKAYGRMGLAYSSSKQYEKAKECYQKAIQLEPGNESLRSNLQIVEEESVQRKNTSVDAPNQPNTLPNTPNVDLSSLLRNPVLLNMARQMLSDPAMQSVMSSLMSGNMEHDDRIDSLLEAGQQMARRMQRENPTLVESSKSQADGLSESSDDSKKGD